MNIKSNRDALIDIFKLIYVEKSTRNQIFVNGTVERGMSMNLILINLLGPMCFLFLLTYNSSGILELLFNVFIIVGYSLIFFFKRTICKKTILFDYEKQHIVYDHFFYGKKNFKFSEIDITKKYKTQTYKGTTTSYYQFYISNSVTKKEHFLFTVNESLVKGCDFLSFLNFYMQEMDRNEFVGLNYKADEFTKFEKAFPF